MPSKKSTPAKRGKRNTASKPGDFVCNGNCQKAGCPYLDRNDVP